MPPAQTAVVLVPEAAEGQISKRSIARGKREPMGFLMCANLW